MPLIQSAKNAAAAVTSLGVTMANTTSGHLMLVAVYVEDGNPNAVSSVVDNQSNTYTEIMQDSPDVSNMSLWYAWNIVGGTTPTITVNISVSATMIGMIAREYSGVLNTSNPLDKFAFSSGSSGTAITSGATTVISQANELVIGIGETEAGSNTYTAGSGYGNLYVENSASVWRDFAMQDLTTTTAAAQTSSMNVGTSGFWIGMVATFRLAGSVSKVASVINSVISKVSSIPLASINKIAGVSEGSGGGGGSVVEYGFASGGFAGVNGSGITSGQQATWAADFLSMGVGWVRFDCNWLTVEATQGTFNWGNILTGVTAAIANGLQVLLILDAPNNCPSWVTTASSGGTNYPTNMTQWAAFCTAVANEFVPRGVLAYEIWNEPNGGNWTVPPAAYVTMLKSAYGAIKAVTGGGATTVITGGVCPGGSINVPTYVADMYTNGAHGYFDAIGVHPYVYNDTPYGNNPNSYGDPSWTGMYSGSPNIVSLMSANGDSAKKIWCTEWGFPTVSPFTEAEQSSQMVAAIADWQTYPWAGNFFMYTYIDSTTIADYAGNVENSFGVVRVSTDYSNVKSANKAAYAAVAAQIAAG